MAERVYTTKFKTTWVIILTAAVLIGWDIYAFMSDETGATISEILINFAREHPVLPFAFGVLMGHLFWPQVEKLCAECKCKLK